MSFEIIIKVIFAVAGGIVTSIPFIFSLIANVKARNKSITDAEKARAESAIKDELKNLVKNAETTYRDIDVILKSQGTSAGPMKKAEVMKALKVFCLENGYDWDEECMSSAVENEVAYTKKVNSNISSQV